MAKTTTTTKPAAKTSPAKGKPAAKTTQAPAAQTQAPAAPTLAYTLIEGYRPEDGLRLYSHTMAVFQLLGLMNGKSAPTSLLTRAIGPSAMRYHAGKFETTAAGKALTAAGLAFFQKRPNNPEWVAKYMGVLSTGKPDGDLIKNEGGIKPIAQ